MVKVLHVNYSELEGGAATGVNRLHKTLLKLNIESKILVIQKNTKELETIGSTSTFDIIFSLFKISLSRYLKKKLINTTNKETFSFNFFSSNILKKINKIDADIVHLHWIGNEMISISQLKKINKPIIWSFWDMWPICGAEHYSYDTRYIDGYKKNNRPKDESGIDINRLIWEHKKRHFDFNFNINVPSEWFYKEVKKSALHKHRKITYIPLNIDTSIWKPQNIKLAREIFNLDENKKILLFGSSTATDHRKGFDFLLKLFKQKKFENYQLIIFGEQPEDINKLNIEYNYVGKIHDNRALSLLYSSADILLMPSKIEVFGQIGLEANACGTPCIIFENTGAEDFIKHKKNGYVAKYLDIEDYANGINWILEDQERYQSISNNGLAIVKNNFNDTLIGEKFIQEYKSLINIK